MEFWCSPFRCKITKKILYAQIYLCFCRKITKFDTLFHIVKPVVVAARARDDGGKIVRITVVDAEGRGGEILVRCGFDTEDTVPEFDDIEIDFEDSFLAPEQFDEYGEVGLEEFAGVGASRRAEDILGGLLRYGTATGDDVTHSFISIESIDHVVIGEAAMFVEMGVLGFDYRADEIR